MTGITVHSLLIAAAVSCTGITSDFPETSVMVLSPIGYSRNLFVGEAMWGRKGVASWEAIDDGHRMRESGDEIAAISQWQHLAARYKEDDSEAACAALRNLAVCHSNRGENSAAVSCCKQIISVGNSAGLNAAYYACKELSDLYVEFGDVDESLRFARMAQCQFTFSDFCGIAHMTEQHALDQRIEMLSAAKLNQSKIDLSK